LRAYTLDMRKCEHNDAGYTIVCLHACMLTMSTMMQVTH